MEDVTTKQFYIGLIARDEDRSIPMEVLPVLEDKLNEEIDLLSLDTPLCKLYITVDLTTKQEPKVLTKVDGTVLEVEVVLSQSVLTDAAEFEGVLRRVLCEGLEGVEGVPGEMLNILENNID